MEIPGGQEAPTLLLPKVLSQRQHLQDDLPHSQMLRKFKLSARLVCQKSKKWDFQRSKPTALHLDPGSGKSRRRLKTVEWTLYFVSMNLVKPLKKIAYLKIVEA